MSTHLFFQFGFQRREIRRRSRRHFDCQEAQDLSVVLEEHVGLVQAVLSHEVVRGARVEGLGRMSERCAKSCGILQRGLSVVEEGGDGTWRGGKGGSCTRPSERSSHSNKVQRTDELQNNIYARRHNYCIDIALNYQPLDSATATAKTGHT